MYGLEKIEGYVRALIQHFYYMVGYIWWWTLCGF